MILNDTKDIKHIEKVSKLEPYAISGVTRYPADKYTLTLKEILWICHHGSLTKLQGRHASLITYENSLTFGK